MSAGLIPCTAPAEAVVTANKATSGRLDLITATRSLLEDVATIATGGARTRPRSPAWGGSTAALICPSGIFSPLGGEKRKRALGRGHFRTEWMDRLTCPSG